MGIAYERDGDGNVINPPINSDIERRLYEASQRADQVEVNAIQEEYNDWRDEKISRDESSDDARGPEVQLTADPPNSTAAVTGAPQNIVVEPEAPAGPVTEQTASGAVAPPQVEHFESPMSDPEFFDKLAAAIQRGQSGQDVQRDSVQDETAKNPDALHASDVAVPPAEAPPTDTGNVPPAQPATGEAE
jgi:hypothetical protein